MTRRRATALRHPILAALVIIVVGALTASSVPILGAAAPAATRLPSLTVVRDPGVPAAVLVSRTLFDSAPAAVVLGADASAAEVQRARDTAVENRLPMFEVGRDVHAVRDELARLRTVGLIEMGDVPDLGVPVSDDAPAPAVVSAVAGQDALVLVAGGPDAVTTAESAGTSVVGLPVGDARATGESVAALKSDEGRPVVAIGAFGDEKTFAGQVDAARTVPELPGGGQLVFPGRRVVALYGSPGSADLGPLGAQGVDESIRRVKRMTRPYDALSDVPVVPAFEIIATVASADPGSRGDYTNMLDPATLRPWIDAAEKAGVYVTLDLQPGRMDFLTQAKKYRGLLRRPNVGLALDPEWRLKPNQKHLTQIGSVEPAEVNRTADWLAGLVRSENLPQKAFVLHQFDAAMLGDRRLIDTSHPELATVIHADGHGTPSVKMETWRRIIAGLPPNVWLGWKNFYTEDKPMFSPRHTLRVNPEPWFVSYQ
ncbi:hypothetical protein [Gordonia liuliyuniae]|uniref:Cell wall binding repeat 2 n=1 Tax=Gordonia liuliyuniae TaxID=2911517 RepID=A0ABS9IT43_9ACTN|nr:hypothetical protein [Gordonia liuliyuniae]MCF8588708.1 hypothetical protein [Gordonia liuliyuniae]